MFRNYGDILLCCTFFPLGIHVFARFLIHYRCLFSHCLLWSQNSALIFRYFFATITSAFLGTLTMEALTLFVFIDSFIEFNMLDQGNVTAARIFSTNACNHQLALARFRRVVEIRRPRSFSSHFSHPDSAVPAGVGTSRTAGVLPRVFM